MFKVEEPPRKRVCHEVIVGEHSYGVHARGPVVDGHSVRAVRRLLDERESSDDEFIDPIGLDESDEAVVPYDNDEARRIMVECQNHVSALKRPHSDEDEDTRFNAILSDLSKVEKEIVRLILRYLKEEDYSRQVYLNNPHEVTLRRLHIDRTSQLIRHALASSQWDKKKTRSIHKILVEHLSVPYLVAYLDVLQVLRSKIPTLVDEMVGAEGRSTEAKSLALLLKRPWDPALHFNCQKTKYPQTASATAPIFIALPVCLQSSQVSRRWRTWQNLITPATGGKVYSIDVEEKADSGKVSADSAAAGIANDCTCMTAPMYVQAVLKATKAKIKKLHDAQPQRPIVLIGWSVCALLACEVASTENIAAVVCFSLPTFGLDGSLKGCKSLDGMTCPVFLVAGAHSRMSSVEALQELRSGLHKDSAIMLVSGADDQLNLSDAGKLHFSLTQPLIDRFILDEMFLYLEEVLPRATAADGSSEEHESKAKKKARVNRELTILGPGPHAPMILGERQPSPNTIRHIVSRPCSAHNSPAPSRKGSRASSPDPSGGGGKKRVGPRGLKLGRPPKSGASSRASSMPSSPKGSNDASPSSSQDASKPLPAVSVNKSTSTLSTPLAITTCAVASSSAISIVNSSSSSLLAVSPRKPTAVPVVSRPHGHPTSTVASATAAVSTIASTPASQTAAIAASTSAAVAAAASVSLASTASPIKVRPPQPRPQSIAKVLGGAGRQSRTHAAAINTLKPSQVSGQATAQVGAPSISLVAALPNTSNVSSQTSTAGHGESISLAGLGTVSLSAVGRPLLGTPVLYANSQTLSTLLGSATPLVLQHSMKAGGGTVLGSATPANSNQLKTVLHVVSTTASTDSAALASALARVASTLAAAQKPPASVSQRATSAAKPVTASTPIMATTVVSMSPKQPTVVASASKIPAAVISSARPGVTASARPVVPLASKPVAAAQSASAVGFATAQPPPTSVSLAAITSPLLPGKRIASASSVLSTINTAAAAVTRIVQAQPSINYAVNPAPRTLHVSSVCGVSAMPPSAESTVSSSAVTAVVKAVAAAAASGATAAAAAAASGGGAGKVAAITSNVVSGFTMPAAAVTPGVRAITRAHTSSATLPAGTSSTTPGGASVTRAAPAGPPAKPQ